MPKVYFCKNIKSSSVICGETDPDRFEKGRYSTCRACRASSQKSKKEEIKVKEIDEKNDGIDPSRNLRKIIEDTVVYKPLFDNMTIGERFRNIDNRILDNIEIGFDNYEKNNHNYSYLLDYIKKLEARIETLEKEKMI
jgi:hypothetical protein